MASDPDDLTVLHVDMNAFYVEVERLSDPGLRGVAVIVGGTGPRGVVASASYEARARGVRSAMPMAQARQRCPEAVVLGGSHARYREVSAEVHRIFAEVTPLIEPIALDEAFLDVAGARRLFGQPEEIARRLRNQIREELGLGCSVGVAGSKFIAKLASEAAKPIADPRGVRPGLGIKVVPRSEMLGFLHAHPVRALWGVGPATLAKLADLGVATVGDLAMVPADSLVARLGESHGRHLARLARGVDEPEVTVGRAAKSISHERTFDTDIVEREQLERALVGLADAVASRLRRADVAARTISLKVRYGDFSLVTRAVTIEGSVVTGPAMMRHARELLAQLPIERGVRLIGLAATGLGDDGPAQLSLDIDDADPPPGDTDDWRDVSAVMDEIRSKFGDRSIGPGAVVERPASRGPD